jgi:hypothetical protein
LDFKTQLTIIVAIALGLVGLLVPNSDQNQKAEGTSTPTPNGEVVAAKPTPEACLSAVSLIFELWILGREEEGGADTDDKTDKIISPPNAPQGKNWLQVTYDFEGHRFGMDESVIMIDQDGREYVVNLANYDNGRDGVQTVYIPLSDFKRKTDGGSLDPNKPVGLLHKRFWHEGKWEAKVLNIYACS